MEAAFKNIILVPTDFSEVCDNALSQGADIAKFFNFELVILHVVDKNTKTHLKKYNLELDSIEKQLGELAEKYKKEKKIKVSTMLKEGDIFTTIPEVAGDIKAGLMMLGTHGKVGMQKLTGSFAIKVVTASPIPVIVVQKRQFMNGYKSIVLPITSDAGPWEKTTWAAYIAKTFGSSIHILRTDENAVEKAVAQITEFLGKQGIKFDVKTASGGQFSKQVIDYATSINADMVMIMTNPDKGFSTFILGSYDEEMIFNTSQIPVMCINPRQYNWEKVFKY